VSQLRFLTDEDFNEDIVEGVFRREPAIEFLAVRDVDLRGRPDGDVLEYGATHGLVLLSHDVNTMRGHAYERVRSNRPMPGLFIVRQHIPVGPVIESLILLWSASDAEEWEGHVGFLPL